MFTLGNLILGSIAALIVGLSKTAFPGAALVATPLIATIVTGRLIPGTTLPILFAGDIFAVIWYGRHARWDLLRPMIIPSASGSRRAPRSSRSSVPRLDRSTSSSASASC